MIIYFLIVKNLEFGILIRLETIIIFIFTYFKRNIIYKIIYNKKHY